MDKKKLKQELAKALKSEMTGTGTGASVTPGVGMGVATKYAFKKKVKEDAPQLAAGKVKDNYAVSHFGFKEAPSIANRKSDAIDYKKIFEGDPKPGVKYNYKGDSGFISTGGSSDPKNWKFLGDKGKYPYLSVKADLIPSEKQPGKYDGAFDLGLGKGHHIDESSNKIHIGTDTKTDSDVYFEPSTGTFSINVIDTAGNRINKLQANTIDDVLTKFPNWKWTEQGKTEFADALNELDTQNSNTDEILTYLQAAKQNGTLSPDAQEVFVQWMNTPGASRDEIIKVLRKLTGMYLKEGYSQFRNETKTRTKPEQFHSAVRQVKQKVNEINRLFEYMNRLQSELSESEGGLKYKKYTEKAIHQIKESTKSLFFKSTKLK